MNQKLDELEFTENEKNWIKVLTNNNKEASLEVKIADRTYKVSYNNFMSEDAQKDDGYPIMVFFPTYEKSKSYTNGVLSELYLEHDDNPDKLEAWKNLLKDKEIKDSICSTMQEVAKHFISRFCNNQNLKEIVAGSFEDYDLKKIARILKSLKIFSEKGDMNEIVYDNILGIMRVAYDKSDKNNPKDKELRYSYEEFFSKTKDVPSIYTYEPKKSK